MTRGTKYPSNSNCKCGSCGRPDRPNGHMPGSGGLYRKGYCHRCNKTNYIHINNWKWKVKWKVNKESFQESLDKALKPVGVDVGKILYFIPLELFKLRVSLEQQLQHAIQILL